MNASLIVTIVRKGWGSTVLDAAVAAGARGGTVIVARGAGINEKRRSSACRSSRRRRSS